MLDMLKNLGDLPNLMRKAQEMKGKMDVMRAELAKRQFSADAGGGMVTAIVNGQFELVRIRIDKTRIDVNETELLEDMITAAVAAAQRKAAEMVSGEMARMSQEMGIPPGMMP